MRILVCAAGKHGSTEEIARAVAERMAEHGHETVLTAPEEAWPAQVDAAVLGSAVYVGRWLPAMRDLVEEHAEELRRLPVWLFSSGPVGDPPKPPEESPDGLRLAVLVEARGHRTLVGRLDRARLGLGERAIVRLLGASTDDCRDFAAVRAFADDIAAALAPSGAPVPTA
jgi:menaquinone-dependent protoporphyrinogen oxidase